MKLGIMQPYFLPYIGYWQLLNTVDTYVVYDDVNYIKGGWINRNRILVNGDIKYISLELQGASSYKKINEIKLSPNKKSRSKLLKTIEQSYKKAPMFQDVFPLMERIFLFDTQNLSSFVYNSIDLIMQYLKINTKLVLSSELKKNNELKGQDKVIEICKKLNADTYINAAGGKQLYSFRDFSQQGINLKFLETDSNITYNQLTDDFYPSLSILDILMMLSVDDINTLLTKYRLLDESCYA